MASLGTFLLLATFVVCSYAAVASVVGARRGSRRLIESGIGAFYLITALMTVASAVMINAFLTDDYSIKYVQHYSDSVQPLFYKITSYWGGLDGSIMFWVFLLSIFGVDCGLREPRAAPRADPLRRRDDHHGGDVLPLPDGRAQEPVHDVPHDAADRRAGAEPAAAERLHGDPPAVALHGLRRDDDSVRVRHRGAHHRPSRRLVAARRPPLDDVQLAVPVLRPHARDDLGVRGARVGRLLGLGSGRERGAAAVVHGDGVPALGDGPGAAQHAARLERHARHRHLLPDDLRHVHDALGRRAVGARVRRGSRRWRGCSPASWS